MDKMKKKIFDELKKKSMARAQKDFKSGNYVKVNAKFAEELSNLCMSYVNELEITHIIGAIEGAKFQLMALIDKRMDEHVLMEIMAQHKEQSKNKEIPGIG